MHIPVARETPVDANNHSKPNDFAKEGDNVTTAYHKYEEIYVSNRMNISTYPGE